MIKIPQFENFLFESNSQCVGAVKSAMRSKKVNSVTFNEVVLPLAKEIDSYSDTSRNMGDLSYSPKTVDLFIKLTQSMAADFNDVNESAIFESKESDAVKKGILKAINAVDESLSYKDFAVAVAGVIKDEYGTHNIKPFMGVLHKELGI